MSEAQFERYGKYIDSGVERLGEAPVHWKPSRIKDCWLTPLSNGIFKKKDQFGSGTKLVNVRDLFQDNYVIKFEQLDRVNTTSNEAIKYSVDRGDIFFVRSSLKLEGIGISALIDNMAEPTVFECHIIRLRPNPSYVCPKYLIYLLNSHKVSSRFIAISQTVTMTTISQEKISSLELFFPPLDEQKAIADYLDEKTTQIDRKVELLSRKAELYGKLKQSLINETVTRGLDPSVAMKDSGVEWLGEVPAHWEVKRIKDCWLKPLSNGIFKKREYFGSGKKLVNVGDLYQSDHIIRYDQLDRVNATPNEVTKYSVNPGDIFFVRSSLKLEGIGISALIIDTKEPTIFECHIIRFRPDPSRVSSKYLIYLLNSLGISSRFIAISQTVTMTTISQEKISGLALYLPSLDEQKAIADYLDTKTAQIDRIIETIQAQIEKLQELRKTLINDVVTGKIKVV